MTLKEAFRQRRNALFYTLHQQSYFIHFLEISVTIGLIQNALCHLEFLPLLIISQLNPQFFIIILYSYSYKLLIFCFISVGYFMEMDQVRIKQRKRKEEIQQDRNKK
ncbi:unnamed protein product [Paramecium sonneborni]|uniref:Transmembrane protein n=1 Tax=Paramecium sonneborni TaxID=65129 RepID=A0A8S1MMB8_9CILI|nr:unnamed protein product [Paramecium sonneborni]